MQISFCLGVIFILLAAAAWGLGGVAGQFLFQFYDVGAPWLIAVRQIIAGAVFLGYLLQRGENIWAVLQDKTDRKDLLAFSFLGLLGAQFGFYYTISLCNAATATVLQYTAPIFVMLWMAWKNRCLPEGREFVGIFCTGRRVPDRYSRQSEFCRPVTGGSGHRDHFCDFPGFLYSYTLSAAAKILDDADHRLGAIFIRRLSLPLYQPF
ncbi:MAG: DMT family transporter [Acidaminococcaceae bacterium]|nr:DMT family transporter [Acidaminococcaceae bacterium]